MKTLKKYLLRGTPSLLLPLGAGFVMASSADIRAALGMGVAVLLTTLLSSIVICGIRKLIPDKFHLPIYVLIVTGFVSLIHMLMDAWVPNVVDMLGVHLAALAVSAVPYRSAEELASENGEKKTIICSLITSAIFVVIMVVCSLIIEPITCGTILGFSLGFPAGATFVSEKGGKVVSYVLLALVIALMRKIGHKVCDELEAE